MADFTTIIQDIRTHSEYEKRINTLKSKGFETQLIEKTVKECIENINNNSNRFVIYGEPQCGKTELMIALSAKLIDDGKKIIIVLLNDDIDLLDQNLQRFRNSSINPTPKVYNEILDENIGTRRWIIFCKKNTNNLQKLNSVLSRISDKIIIDDEGDYASPNGKVNKEKRTKINEQIEKLLNYNGTYIGVTATPARLDLNNTFGNVTEKWVRFEAHSRYAGKDIFFPINHNEILQFALMKLPTNGDKPDLLRNALANFIVNSSYLNISNVENQGQYSFLIHTSGEIDEHSKERKIANDYFEALNDENNKNHKNYWEQINLIAKEKATDEAEHKAIVQFAWINKSNALVTILNSKNKANNSLTNDPSAFFTVFIGGNKVSRGITFGNLLGMFFTRDAKHKIQQDTYIQRARMFGNRLKYIAHFQLWITEPLYNDWRRCFVYHYLSLKSIETNGNAPVWIGDNRVNPVSNQSIDKKTLVIDKGEMAFAKSQYVSGIEIALSEIDKIKRLEKLQQVLGEESFPTYVLNFIKTNSSNPERDINIVKPRFVDNRKEDNDYAINLCRKRGTFGGQDIIPTSIHHLMVTHNSNGEARLIYYYSSSKVQFFKSEKR